MHRSCMILAANGVINLATHNAVFGLISYFPGLILDHKHYTIILRAHYTSVGMTFVLLGRFCNDVRVWRENEQVL